MCAYLVMSGERVRLVAAFDFLNAFLVVSLGAPRLQEHLDVVAGGLHRRRLFFVRHGHVSRRVAALLRHLGGLLLWLFGLSGLLLLRLGVVVGLLGLLIGSVFAFLLVFGLLLLRGRFLRLHHLVVLVLGGLLARLAVAALLGGALDFVLGGLRAKSLW